MSSPTHYEIEEIEKVDDLCAFRGVAQLGLGVPFFLSPPCQASEAGGVELGLKYLRRRRSVDIRTMPQREVTEIRSLRYDHFQSDERMEEIVSGHSPYSSGGFMRFTCLGL